MGKAIAEAARDRHHEICLIISSINKKDLNAESLSKCDVAIEFTGPESAFENIAACLRCGTPVVSGSTGWLNRFDDIKELCNQVNGSFIYASNFSVGVNLFFELNRKLAELMAGREEYDVALKEVHHTQKKDAPSGTAITLAEQLISVLPGKTGWTNSEADDNSKVEIISERVDPAPGTHHVKYLSDVDDIEIIHTAHNRKGFANGAVLAAEFLRGKKGVYTMKDVLGLG